MSKIIPALSTNKKHYHFEMFMTFSSRLYLVSHRTCPEKSRNTAKRIATPAILQY